MVLDYYFIQFAHLLQLSIFMYSLLVQLLELSWSLLMLSNIGFWVRDELFARFKQFRECLERFWRVSFFIQEHNKVTDFYTHWFLAVWIYVPFFLFSFSPHGGFTVKYMFFLFLLYSQWIEYICMEKSQFYECKYVWRLQIAPRYIACSI